MPIVNIPNYGPVSFPEGMSEAEIQTRARDLANKFAKKYEYKPDYRDLGIGQLMYGGARRGLSGLGSTITDLIPALAGSALGFEDYAKQQLEEAQQKRREVEEKFPTAFKTFRDVDGVGRGAGYVAESLGELTPDMLAMLTGAGTLGAVGRRAAVKSIEEAAAKRASEMAAKKGMDDVAKATYAERLEQAAAPLAAKAGARAQGAGLYGVSLGLNAPNTFQGIFEETENLAPGVALTFGAAQAALDSLIPARILSQFSPAAKASAAKALIDETSVVPPSVKAVIAKELLKTGAGEAATEGTQEILSILAERVAGATGEPFSQKNLDRIINASIKGLIGGTAFGTPGAIAEGVRAKGQAPEPGQPTTPEIEDTSVPPITPSGLPPPTVTSGAAAPTPTAPAIPANQAISRWTDANLNATLEMQLRKPEEQQNTALLDALLAEKLRRAALAEEGAPDVESPAEPPIQPEPSAERPVAEIAGEGVSVPSGLAPTEPTSGVAAPEPSTVGRGGEPARPIDAGAAVQPSALETAPPAPTPVEPPAPVELTAPPPTAPAPVEPPAPAPAPAPVAPPTPAVPEGVSRETLLADLKQIVAAKQELMVKGSRAGFRTPFKNSPARKKFDALDEQLTQKQQQWKDLTGEEFDTNLLGLSPEGRVVPEAAAPAPAPVEPPPPAPAPAPATVEPPPPAPAPAPVEPPASVSVPEFLTPGAIARWQPKGQPPLADGGVLILGKPYVSTSGESVVQVKFPNRLGSADPKGFDGEGSTRQEVRVSDLSAPKKKASKQKAPAAEPVTEAELTPEEQADLQAELDEAQGVTTPAAEPAAPKPEAKKRGRPKKELTEEQQKAKTALETERAKKKEEREAKKKAEEDEQKRLQGLVIEHTYKVGSTGETVTEKLTPNQIADALRAQQNYSAKISETEQGGYYPTRNDSAKRRDQEIVLGLLASKRDMSKDAVAARAYFSKTKYITNALYDLAFDLTHRVEAFRKGVMEGNVESARFSGTGGQNAIRANDWVLNSKLTPETKALYNKYVAEHAASVYKTYEGLKEFNEQQARKVAFAGGAAERTAEARRDASKKKMEKIFGGKEEVDKAFNKALKSKSVPALDFDVQNFSPADAQAMIDGYLRLDAPSQFALPLHPVVRGALQAGDLKQALRLLSADFSNTGLTADLAKVYESVIGTTDVVVVNELTDPSGKRVPGYFDPTSNIIFLDSEAGMNTHALFHELGHATTSHVLANPSHPVTKQLTQLFNDVKGSLDTAYGATSVDEFVAEAWANEDFKAKLNAINPKGEKITAWSRFVNAVRNLFRALTGRATASVETAFDRTDKAIRAILSPAPSTRESETLYALTVNPRSSLADDTLNAIARGAAMLPRVDSEQGQKMVSNFHEFFKNRLGGTGKSIVMSTLPLDAFTDAIEGVLPGAKRINTLVNERHGDEGMRNQRIEPVIQYAEKWAGRATPEVEARFNNVVYDSTLERVDPQRSRQYYADRYSKDPEKQAEALATWDRLNAELDAVEKAAPGAKRLYALMRNTYQDLYKEILNSLVARIDQSVTDPATRKTLKNEILQKLADKGNIDPYFPLTRNGNYWLRFEAKDAQGLPNLYMQTYETERERNQAVAELEKLQAQGEVSNIHKFSSLSEISYRKTPSNSFVNAVLKVMELNKPENKQDAMRFDSAMEGILRMYLTTLPETSFAKAFQRRKDRLGFSKDSIRALREKSYSLSRQLSNMKYASLLYEQSDKLRDYVRKMGEGEGSLDNKTAKEYFDALQDRIDFAVSPTVSRWAQLATTFGFNYLLGFNVSSALVNMTQVPLIVMPYLGGKYGYSEANKALAEATRAYMGSGFSRTVELMGSNKEKVKVKAMASIDNYDFDAADTPAYVKKYKTLTEVAAKMGQLNRSQLYDMLDVDGSRSPIATLNAAGGFAFHHAERMNRQVTLMAAYNLELARLKKAEPSMDAKAREIEAAERAVSMTESTNGGVSAASAPRIAQNSLGRVLFMFKRYSVSMYYMLYKMTREIMQNQDPAVRSAAMKQLAGVYGTAGIFAGLQGMPLFGVLAMVYNMLKDDDEENFGSVVRGYSGETLYKGLINATTGLSVAERTGLSDLLFRDSPFSTGSTSLADSLAQIMGGPVYGVASRIQRGWNLLMEGETQRGIESMIPVAFANLLKSVRYATEGATTLRGDPVIGDIGPWNIAAQFLGFTPAEYTRQLEQNSMLKGIEKAVAQERTKQLRQLYIADRFGDTDGYNEARQKLEALYDKHPDLGNLQETIKRSMAQHKRTTETMYHGIVLNKKLEQELKELVDDWEPTEE